MPQISAQTLENSLNGTDTNRKFFTVTKSSAMTATKDGFYVLAGIYAASRPDVRPGTARWCTATNTGTTAQQRDEVYAAMVN